MASPIIVSKKWCISHSLDGGVTIVAVPVSSTSNERNFIKLELAITKYLSCLSDKMSETMGISRSYKAQNESL